MRKLVGMSVSVARAGRSFRIIIWMDGYRPGADADDRLLFS